jgi:hypothetical protein
MRRAVIAVVLVLALSVIVFAQNIKPPSNASTNYPPVTASWSPNTSVNVYINTNSYPIGSSNWNAITAGFKAANSSYMMNVNFNFVGYSGTPPAPQGDYVYVYQQVPTPNGQNCANCLGNTSYHFDQTSSYNGEIDSAAMQLNPAISTPQALQTTVAHEASHTFGLDDCPACQSLSDSLMYQAPSFNFTTTYYPTTNDMYAQFTYAE